jgi:hypothetical protein
MSWKKIDGILTQLAVGRDNNVWGINFKNEVKYFPFSTFSIKLDMFNRSILPIDFPIHRTNLAQYRRLGRKCRCRS